MQTKIIPSKWVQSLQLQRLLTYGVAYEKRNVYKVFISPMGFDVEPNFRLCILGEYDRDRAACYLAHIIQVFGEIYLIECNIDFIYDNPY